MFAGPIIAREVLTSPRPLRFYATRASYAALLFILMWTAWQSLVGWREVRDVGILARFGGLLFLVLVLVQLTLMLFFAPLAAATAVALEKDRRTFVLLLMTDLRDVEIVLGKLTASLLQIVTQLATAAPVFMICLLLGGVSPAQVGEVLGVTAAAGLAGGSLGLVVALWRDRTFQSLAMTVLLVVLALAGVEALSAAWPGARLLGLPLALPEARLLGIPLRSPLNPYRVVHAAVYPGLNASGGASPTSLVFVLASLTASLALNSLAVLGLRAWNPGRNEPREEREGEAVAEGETLIQTATVPDPVELPMAVALVGASPTIHDPARTETGGQLRDRIDGDGDLGATTGLHVPRRTHRRIGKPPAPYRIPWNNPILWREVKTRAYGPKPLIIKGAYLLAFILAVAFSGAQSADETNLGRAAWALVPMAVLSLILINAQGVTALTSERDTGALDLLLVTELTPREFIHGKLHGVLYNTKEMIALPVLLAVWLAISGAITAESALFAIVDFVLLVHFAAMLGLHAAITYTNSRTAVAHSLGTIFFLMTGIGICAGLIIISDREFGRQLLSFMIFIGAGSVALFGSLGARNPSRAIALVALLTPFWTFYCIISLLLGDIVAAFLVSAGIYGFALLAMLVPAVSDFDIALGRTNAIQG